MFNTDLFTLGLCMSSLQCPVLSPHLKGHTNYPLKLKAAPQQSLHAVSAQQDINMGEREVKLN